MPQVSDSGQMDDMLVSATKESKPPPPDANASNELLCERIRVGISIIGAFFIIAVNTWMVRSLSLAYSPILAPEFVTEHESSVFIAVITDARYQKACNYTYHNVFLPMIKAKTIYDVGYFGTQPPETPNLGYPYSYGNFSADHSLRLMISRFYNGLIYFLKNTSCQWFFRVCEDTGINPRTFHFLLEELESHGDPNINTIILSGCVCKRHITYPQGGSGFALSRKAAEMFLQDFDMLMKLSSIGPDDCIFGTYISRKGISFYSTTSRWILGHTPLGFETEEKIKETVKRLPQCPERIGSSSNCRMFLQRFRDLAIWHYLSAGNNIIFKLGYLRDSIPENVFFYVPADSPVFCVGRNETDSHYIN